MSGGHPDPADLALAALPAEPSDPTVAVHLTGCARCREHVDALARTVTLARTGALAHDGAADVDAGPVPDRVWAAIAAELGPELGRHPDPVPRSDSARGRGAPPTPATPFTPPKPASTPSPSAPPRRPRPWRVAVAALVALSVGLGIGVALDRAIRTDASATVVAQLAPFGTADPTGRGTLTTVEHDGVRTMTVHLTGVSSPAGADFLEAWLLNPAAHQIVALGALTHDGAGYDGSFTVPANLPMDRLPVVDISAERYDGDPGHSGVSILRGTLS